MLDISVKLVAKENVVLLWPLVEQGLKGVIKDHVFGEYNSEDLLESLIAGKSQLWIVNDKEMRIKMVAITRILKYPRVKRLFMDIILGEGTEECLHLMEVGRQWMKQFGATQIEAHTRPSLARLLKRKSAFKAIRTVLLEDCNADLPKTQWKMELGQTRV